MDETQTAVATTPEAPETNVAAPGPTPAQAGLTQEEYEELVVGSSKFKVQKGGRDVFKNLEKGFQGKAQELAAMQREIKAAMDNWKGNPDTFFEQLGINPDEYAQARMAKYLEQQAMSPEARRAVQLEKEKEAQKAELQKYKDKEKLDADEAQYKQHSQAIRSELVEALKKTSLPEASIDPEEMTYLAGRTVAMKRAAEEQGLDWTWDDCASKIEDAWWQSTKKTLSQLKPEQAEERFGRDFFTAWREFDLKRVTPKAAAKNSPPKKQQMSPSEDPSPASTERRSKVSNERKFEDLWDKL